MFEEVNDGGVPLALGADNADGFFDWGLIEEKGEKSENFDRCDAIATGGGFSGATFLSTGRK